MRSQILVQNGGGALGENVTFDLSMSALEAGIWGKIIKNGKNY